MKRTPLGGRYDVKPGEHIVIVMTPRDGAGEANVTAASDGENEQFVSGTTPRLEFDCLSGKGDTTSAAVTCSFPGDIPDDASFLIEISGNPGEDTDSREVAKSDPNHEPSFRFKGV